MIKKYIRKVIENALLSTMDCYNLEITKKRAAHKVLYGIKDDYEKVSWDGIVECAKCGCLLYKVVAIKGKSMIKRKPKLRGVSMEICYEEYIYIPYYCKVHAPKIKQEDKK